ncbi:xanthine dehydrogenase family protein molybdopterin-binding subunit [Bordetella petrii]|uniref:xanthine dehydrogenase family protein molybdopterin-binding subunit n=1 Tax=Bordetella petrii TaxID=94624 RepID=UPI001E4948C1|nr:xanthine dehydrogenase family protein molybdopterin-binding subunit [Bordetella petrii]MCD0504469.1 xanthine dehydrogenase family protein molybdopterin-binding subunit [Bordetella petrii]
MHNATLPASAAATERPASGIGQRIPRREDARHLAGAAAFIADLNAPNCLEIAFVRSPVAHGVLKGVDIGPDVPADMVRHAGHFAHLPPVRGKLLREGFNGAPYPLLATGKVRFVGEPIALVMAPTRAQAEQWAEQVVPRIEALPAVADARAEWEHPTPPLHEGLQSNLIMCSARSVGEFDRIAQQAGSLDLRQVTREFTMARVLASPLEGRGVLALRDKASGAIHLHLSTQRPHLIRSFVAEQLPGLRESDLRVIVPDVGGGFGAKSNLYPEEVLLTALAIELGRPVRWIEDRYEHFVASNHSRQHDQRITAYFDAHGRIHAIDARFIVDGGAYCAKTSTGAIEANMAANIMLGPYDIRNYRYEAVSIYTNKSPMGPYRGVGRPGGCFAMERIIDEVAHELGMDPAEARRRNLIPRSAMPYVTATGLHYDSGDYREALDAAERHVRERWNRDARPGRRAGIGYAMLVEQAGHGSVEWFRRGSPTVYGHEAARATLNGDGTLEIDVGTLAHGQGHATSYAQIAAEITSLPLEAIRIRQGDTAATPYGMGTVASRSIVMGGGAVTQACRMIVDKARRIAAANLGHAPEALRLENGILHGAQDKLSLAEIALITSVQIHKLPRDIEPGMSVQAFYRPDVETGTFSYAVHSARVEVDVDTGFVEITNYLVVEDCGTVVNPLIVDGQIIGGVAQGIGQALYEAMRYNADGQPETVTFGDYALPSALEVPAIDIVHLHTPSPFSAFGVKGMGEGGSVPPPAAIANAVRDALRDQDIAVDRTPICPDYLLEQILVRTEHRA